MIKQGDKITNTRTGQIMIFLKTAKETNGEILQIECYSPPTAVKEPEHIHPKQENIFKITSGSCTFSVDGKEQIVGTGQTISIPQKVRHHFWNSGDTVAHYIQEFKPALNIDSFFETFFALSRDEKLNQKGIPNFFHASLIMLKHRNDIRVTNPPWVLQLITYLTLTPISFLMGFRADYKSKK
ncbi:MAG: cupin domain-containing protein [bacterium]|nr:cupin domain-containing protein [bacterium]MDQ3112373.1 cupin domain-containing protein [Bacteroidota bacterium]